MLADKISNFSNSITINTCSMTAFRPRTMEYYSLLLSFANENTIIFRKRYLIGDYYKGKEVSQISKIKDNFEQIAGYSIFKIENFLHAKPEVDIFTDVKVKLVMIGDEPFAFGNLEETKFLLLNVNPLEDQQILSKKEMTNELNKLLTYRVNSIFEEFSNDISKLNAFLPNCKQYLSNMYILSFEKLQNLVSKLNNLINKSDS